MSAPDPILTDNFRTVMAHVATPVAVVTTLADGDPYGTTVSAFASLSLHPPMVLGALDKSSDLLAAIRRTGRLGVNILGHHQAGLALAFAAKGGPGKFSGVDWVTDRGLPRLPGSPGWLACDVADLVEGGDHVIALGTVTWAETREALPLTYHGRAFGTHAALELT